jgi:hypothetical protein
MTDTESWEENLGIDGQYRRWVRESEYNPSPVQKKLDEGGEGHVLCMHMVPECQKCKKGPHEHDGADHEQDNVMVEAIFITTNPALMAQYAIDPHHRFRAARLLAEQN